jgi:hypothetical protein
MPEVNIQTKIDTAEAAKGLKDLRKSLKDLVSAQADVAAGSKQFTKLQDAINDTEGKLGDLNDSFVTLRGSGVERLNSSLGILREGFTSADPDKLKIGLQGIGAAMKAIPIFLLIEGAKLLYDNFDKVVTLFGFGASESKKLTEALNEQTEAARQLNVGYERQITLSQAAGLSSIQIAKLEAERGEAALKNNLAQQNALQEAIDRGGDETEERKKQLKELENAYDSLLTNTAATYLKIDGLEQSQAKKAAEEATKSIEEARKSSDDRIKQMQDFLKEREELEGYYAQHGIEVDLKMQEEKNAALIELAQAFKQKNEEFDKGEAETRLEEDRKLSESIKNSREKDFEEKQKLADEDLKAYKKQQALKFQAASQGFSAIKGFSDLYFANQLNRAKGNANEEIKIKKQQFEIEKGLRLANIGIDTASALVKTTAELGGVGAISPPGIALLAGIAGLGVAEAAIVASTKFDGGEITASAPAISSVGSSADTQTDTNTPLPKSTFNPNGIQTNQSDGKVWVLESDITGTQSRVKVLESRSTFP